MSHPVTKPPTYRGRYKLPVSTSNLLSNDSDFSEFEAFEDTPGPRAPPDGSLSVLGVDMLQQINEPNHSTSLYDIDQLVIRRSQDFLILVTFSRPLTEGDDFQLEFLIGSDPSPNQGSHQIVTFGARPGGSWVGQVVKQEGAAVTLSVTTSNRSIVGKYRTYVAVSTGNGMQRTARDQTTDFYLLFNPWAPDDETFLANQAERQEYVLNDYGVIFQGSVGAVGSRSWVFGQFERGVLDACINLLDSSRMPIFDRGDVIKVVRKGSAVINSQDDNGVCVGNWGDDFSMGVAPTSWTGSVKILQQYASTGVPVCYAQCWVFAGVFNTFLRAIGIASRTITNFSSAHDNTGNLRTDLVFLPDGSPDERHTDDSIWNYHCWNECWFHRTDLPAGYGGWQVVDATPQETSDGYYRCGPASVQAIKEGQICHPYDAKFILAEVNSDVVCHKRDRYGTLTPYRRDTTMVGQYICTKALNGNAHVDITLTYKYPEGSDDERRTLALAESYGCEMDQSKIDPSPLKIIIHVDKPFIGQDVVVRVDFVNQSDARLIEAALLGYVTYYTGVRAAKFKDYRFRIPVGAHNGASEVVRIRALDYMPFLGAQSTLHFVVTGLSESVRATAMRIIDLGMPELSVTVTGVHRVGGQLLINVSFTNPFSFALENVQLHLEGAGVIPHSTRSYNSIPPHGSIQWQEPCSPRLGGHRCVVAVMDSLQVRQITGASYFNVDY